MARFAKALQAVPYLLLIVATAIVESESNHHGALLVGLVGLLSIIAMHVNAHQEMRRSRR